MLHFLAKKCLLFLDFKRTLLLFLDSFSLVEGRGFIVMLKKYKEN